ncbi:MAG: NnrU family protein [Henriciella sp.]
MVYFLVGLGVFFGVHIFSAVRSRAPGRDLKQKLGYAPYMGLYSLASIIGFVLIIYGYGETRGMGLFYRPPVWAQHLNVTIMLPALILLVASQLPAGRIKKITKHPMLLATKLWAVGHLLSNGEINAVILFGSFLAYAVFDRIMVKRRGDTGPGPDIKLSAVADIGAVVIGLAVWAALILWLHPILFGVEALVIS